MKLSLSEDIEKTANGNVYAHIDIPGFAWKTFFMLTSMATIKFQSSNDHNDTEANNATVNGILKMPGSCESVIIFIKHFNIQSQKSSS